MAEKVGKGGKEEEVTFYWQYVLDKRQSFCFIDSYLVILKLI